MKRNRPFGTADQGFVLAALMISVAVLSMTTFYVINQNKILNLHTKTSEMDRARALTELTNMSSLSRARGLLSAAKVGSTYESAVYPENYFADVWKLTKNTGSAKPLDQIDVKGDEIWLPSSAPGAMSLTQADAIFKGNARQTDLLTSMQNVEIVAIHQHKKFGNYIETVDIKTTRPIDVRAGGKSQMIQTTGRIALAAPLPKGLKLQVKFPGETNFTDEWKNSGRSFPAGDYGFRLFGSGVVYFGEVIVNGETHQLGVDANSKITHQANNIKAVDKLIGEFSVKLGEGGESSSDPKVTIDECRFEVSGGGAAGGTPENSITVEARLYGVDEKTSQDLSDTGVIKISGGASDAPPEQPGSYGCEDRCPVVYKTEFWPNLTTQAKYLDLTVQGETDTKKLDYFEPDLSDEITARAKGIICGNMELVGQAMLADTGKIPSMMLSMGRANYETVRNKYIDAGLKRFYAYTAPTCKRQLVGQRTSCGCFADDTKIQMADGSLTAIRDIREGDVVLNPKTGRGQTVKRVIAGPEKIPMYKISTASDVVVVTHQHPFLLSVGLVSADAIKVGDKISAGSSPDSWQTVTSVEILSWDGKSEAPVVWNIELNGSDDFAEHYVLAGGIMTGDLFLQEQLAKRSVK